AGGNVYVNARIDWDRAADIGNGAPRLHRDGIGGKSSSRQFIQTRFALQSQNSVMKFENFLGCRVAEDGRLDVPDVLRESRPSAVVVGTWFDKVGEMRQPRVVLFGPVKRAHGYQVHDVPADVSLGVYFLRRII